MRILFITSSSINGGAQKHIREMFLSLTKLGHQVFLIAPNGWLTEELKDYERQVKCLSVNLNTTQQVKLLLDQLHPDITNTFILSGGVFGTLAWKKKKYGKLFITVNNPVLYPNISKLRRIVYPRLYRWMSKYASAFLVKADKVRDEVANLIGNKSPVISIKNGIDFSQFNKDAFYPDIRGQYNIAKEDYLVTCVAALDVRKGQEYLIEAAVELRNSYPVHVFLVGEGDDYDRLFGIVKSKNADMFVHFLGRRKDINAILANSDCFVLSSLHEGLPNALMEAMAMGTPCIATDVGGVRQLIDNEVNGLIIDSKSSIQLCEALRFYINNPQTAECFAENAREKMIRQYKQETVTNELITIYTNY